MDTKNWMESKFLPSVMYHSSSVPSDNGSPWSVAMFSSGEQLEMFEKVKVACHRFLPLRTAAANNLTSLQKGGAQELKLKMMSWLYFSK